MTRCAQIFAAYRIERARAVIRTVRFLKEEKNGALLQENARGSHCRADARCSGLGRNGFEGCAARRPEGTRSGVDDRVRHAPPRLHDLRWGARDNLGAKLLAAAEKLEAKDDRTFTLDFKKPFGMVLDAFSKPSSIPLFVMPEKVAQTDPFKQITDMTGSGPYMFAADRYRPGEKVVYLKNPYYVPRNEPADGTAGGKHVYVDELDWVILRDAQTVANAIEKGEVDVVEEVVATEAINEVTNDKKIE